METRFPISREAGHIPINFTWYEQRVVQCLLWLRCRGALVLHQVDQYVCIHNDYLNLDRCWQIFLAKYWQRHGGLLLQNHINQDAT